MQGSRGADGGGLDVEGSFLQSSAMAGKVPQYVELLKAKVRRCRRRFLPPPLPLPPMHQSRRVCADVLCFLSAAAHALVKPGLSPPSACSASRRLRSVPPLPPAHPILPTMARSTRGGTAWRMLLDATYTACTATVASG